MLRERPELPAHLEPIYERYFEIGAGEDGRLRLASMMLLLDELGVETIDARAAVRGHWYAMQGAEVEVERKRREEQERRDEAFAKMRGQPRRRRSKLVDEGLLD